MRLSSTLREGSFADTLSGNSPLTSVDRTHTQNYGWLHCYSVSQRRGSVAIWRVFAAARTSRWKEAGTKLFHFSCTKVSRTDCKRHADARLLSTHTAVTSTKLASITTMKSKQPEQELKKCVHSLKQHQEQWLQIGALPNLDLRYPRAFARPHHSGAAVFAGSFQRWPRPCTARTTGGWP